MFHHTFPNLRDAFAAVSVLSLSVAGAPIAQAQIDTLVTVVPEVHATGGNAIGGVAYNPITDEMFVSAFGPGGGVRKIENVSGTQTSVQMISEGQLQLYYRDGDPNRSVIFVPMSGMLFNPKPIGSIGAHEQIWAVDASKTRFPFSNTIDPDATKQVFRYNTQAIGTLGSPPPPFGDARDVMTTLVTLADMQAQIGQSGTSDNIGRQFAWSSDGQSIYFVNSSAQFEGIWRVTDLDGTGSVSRISDVRINVEPGVIGLGGGVDRIIIRGSDETGNIGGLDYIDFDTVSGTAGAPGILLSAAEFDAFLDRPLTAGAPTTFSITTDEAGNIYFNDTNGSNGGTRTVTRLDPEGRLVKVVSYEERQRFIDAPPNANPNTLRMQIREVNHPTAGPISQLLYAENRTNSVTGVYLFEVGDFDRDGQVTANDLAMFGSALTTRHTPIDPDQFEQLTRFDLNGNGSVDWKDVKILQTFLEFPDGDTDFDGVVDDTDLAVLQANLGSSDATWIHGDFTGDDRVTLYDAYTLFRNYTPSSLPMSVVPEPASAWLILAGSLLMVRRAARRS